MHHSSIYPSPRLPALLVWTGILFLTLTLAGCSSARAETLPYLDLSQRTHTPAAAVTEAPPLRIAVAAIISPQGNVASYSSLAQYLGDKLDRPVELVQRRTYAEVNELVETNAVDMAFVCTSAYVDGSDHFGMKLLAAPEINGESVYQSVLIVPANNPAREMADLRGKVFAFTDPMSFSGRVYPTSLVRQLGDEPETFFGRIFFTYSHDRAIEAVAAGVADGAGVDSLVLDYAFKRNPTLQQKVRVIHRSPEFGIPPLVAPPDLSPQELDQLQKLLLGMDKDPEGRIILQGLGIDRFILADDAAYESARQLIASTGHPSTDEKESGR